MLAHAGLPRRRYVKKKAFQILLPFCLAMLLGCTNSQESRVVGKWACKASGDRMELLENHTCTVSSMGIQYPGRWTVSESGIKIDAGQVVMKGSLDGKNIVAEDTIMHNKYVYEKLSETKS
jgi:hypothetical protein